MVKQSYESMLDAIEQAARLIDKKPIPTPVGVWYKGWHIIIAADGTVLSNTPSAVLHEFVADANRIRG